MSTRVQSPRPRRVGEGLCGPYPSPLARLARAPSISPRPSRDWLARGHTRGAHRATEWPNDRMTEPPNGRMCTHRA
eukprot:9116441-Pyramimonas_sp.AAC.1